MLKQFIVTAAFISASVYADGTFSIPAPNGNTKYVFYPKSSYGANYPNAASFCQTKGGQLATLPNPLAFVIACAGLFEQNAVTPTWAGSYENMTNSCISLFPENSLAALDVPPLGMGHPSCSQLSSFLCEVPL